MLFFTLFYSFPTLTFPLHCTRTKIHPSYLTFSINFLVYFFFPILPFHPTSICSPLSLSSINTWYIRGSLSPIWIPRILHRHDTSISPTTTTSLPIVDQNHRHWLHRKTTWANRGAILSTTTFPFYGRRWTGPCAWSSVYWWGVVWRVSWRISMAFFILISGDIQAMVMDFESSTHSTASYPKAQKQVRVFIEVLWFPVFGVDFYGCLKLGLSLYFWGHTRLVFEFSVLSSVCQ